MALIHTEYLLCDICGQKSETPEEMKEWKLVYGPLITQKMSPSIADRHDICRECWSKLNRVILEIKEMYG